MVPVFEFDSFISEADYRKALKRGCYTPNWFIPFILDIIIFSNSISLSVKYLHYALAGYKRMWIDSIIFLILAIAVIILFIRQLRMPNKIVEKNIYQLVAKTGSKNINTHLVFYEDKILTTSNTDKSNKESYFLYDMIIKITEYDTFLLLGGRESAVYVEKASIPDSVKFNEFIWNKCPDAKYKKIDK